MRNYDPIKKFINVTWTNINRRTVNGLKPNLKSRGTRRYIERNIRLEFSRQEFSAWVYSQRAAFEALKLAGQRPSINRIDSTGNYTLENINIISLDQNRREGRATSRLRALTKRPIKFCIACGNQLVIRTKECNSRFSLRKTCNVICMKHAIQNGQIRRGRAAVADRRKNG